MKNKRKPKYCVSELVKKNPFKISPYTYSQPGILKGFTLVEMVVVLAVISILAAILVPTVAKHIADSQITRAHNEVQVIGSAIASLYKDTGFWPYTNADGPSGGVNRVVGNPATVPVGTGPDAGLGADNWGTLGPIKPLQDYLYFNSPDGDSIPPEQGDIGNYPTEGQFAWRGPYLDKPFYDDPWGRSYVVSARYFPGNIYTDPSGHRVLVLSAGLNRLWSTPFSDSVTRYTNPDDSPRHDDIGLVIYTNL